MSISLHCLWEDENLNFYVFKSYIAMLRSSEPWSHHINKIVIRLDRFFCAGAHTELH